MARTKQRASISTGGKQPRKNLARLAGRKTAPRTYQHESDSSDYYEPDDVDEEPATKRLRAMVARTSDGDSSDGEIPDQDSAAAVANNILSLRNAVVEEAQAPGKRRVIEYAVGSRVVALEVYEDKEKVTEEDGCYYVEEKVGGVTVKKWKVFRIDNKRGRDQYRVIWWNDGKSCKVTWQPRADLEGEFDEHLDLVDRFAKQYPANRRTPELFIQFAFKDGAFGKRIITANNAGNCMFVALKEAVALLGQADQVQDAWVNEFSELGTSGFGMDPCEKATWKIFRAFLRFICFERGSLIAFNLIDENLHPGGARNARSIPSKQFADGVYIAAAYNSTKIGHCFVVLVIQKEVFVIDNDRAVPLKIYGSWIDQIAFVRKVEVFKKPVKN